MLILSINWPVVLYAALMALILLIVLVIVVGKMIDKRKEAQKVIEEGCAAGSAREGIYEAESAAIAMALHLYYGVHDHESDVITIKNISNRYSPWSSKIYGIQ